MRRDLPLCAGLAGVALVAALLGLAIGDQPWGPARTLTALFAAGDPLDRAILFELRAPRAALGFTLGAGLGAAGAALQGYFRNPLADPGVVGVAPAAALGAVAALYFGLASLSPLALPGAALLGALIGTAALFLLAGDDPRPATLILAGVAIASLSGALTALALNLAPNPWALSEIAYWLMGSTRDRSWTDVLLAAPATAAGVVLLARLGPALDALALGEDTAQSLGFPRRATRGLLVAGVLLAVAPGVATAGVVGFVGLVTPHLLRRFVDHEPSRLILPSALGGGALVLLADAGVMALSGHGSPLYLGVFTALVGAPFFLALVRAERRAGP